MRAALDSVGGVRTGSLRPSPKDSESQPRDRSHIHARRYSSSAITMADSELDHPDGSSFPGDPRLLLAAIILSWHMTTPRVYT